MQQASYCKICEEGINQTITEAYRAIYETKALAFRD